MTEAPNRDATLRPGTLVGEYRVVEPIGKGGMGVVYRGTHPELDNAVAIKVLARDHAWDPAAVARFKREARMVSQLRHPNIVQAFSFGSLPDGRRYYVMDYLEGQSLKERLAAAGALSPQLMLSVVRAVAEALAAAHAAGIVHRDIKPANIFLLRSGGVKLLDFGIAKPTEDEPGVDAHTETGKLPGTPRYMSPEQARGVSVDHRTDVYSLGLVAFECLTGEPPFGPGPTGEILMHHQVTAPPPPSQLGAALPVAFDTPILKALRKDPDERQQSALDLAAQLEAAAGVAVIAEQTAVNTYPETPRALSNKAEGTRIVSASRRAPARLLVALAIGVVAAIGAVLYFFGAAHSPPKGAVTERADSGVDAASTPDLKRTQDAATPRADAKQAPPASTKVRKKRRRPKRRRRGPKRPKGKEGSLIRF